MREPCHHSASEVAEYRTVDPVVAGSSPVVLANANPAGVSTCGVSCFLQPLAQAGFRIEFRIEFCEAV